MRNIPYASIVGSLIYAQNCTRPDIRFAVGVLGRYQSNLDLDHWKAVKKIFRYLQGTKDHMLTYRKSDHLEVIGYLPQLVFLITIYSIMILGMHLIIVLCDLHEFCNYGHNG